MHTTKLITHKGDNCITVTFEKKQEFITRFKKLDGAKLSANCYASGLFETGTDLCFIREFLGQNSSKTTEIYTHVSTKSLQNIKRPFADL